MSLKAPFHTFEMATPPGRSPVLYGLLPVTGFFILYFLLSLQPSIPTTPILGDPNSQTEWNNVNRPPPEIFIPAGSKSIKLLIFSDLHFGEDESTFGPEQDRNTLRVMRQTLAFESPDLVVIDGDLITGENTFVENATSYVDMLAQPMLARGVPWASVYGNHDESAGLEREKILGREMEVGAGLCLTRNMAGGDGIGVTNYYVLVKGEDGKPVAVLWFFDSRGGQRFGDGEDVPMFVHPETVRWFERTRDGLEERYGPMQSLAFVHVPPSVFSRAQRIFAENGRKSRRESETEKRTPKSTRYPGLNDDDPIDHQSAPQDGPFVDALQNTPWLHSVYSGHDHGDTWCVPWPDDSDSKQRRHDEEEADDARPTIDMTGTTRPTKPVLCFAKHTGYGGYGEWNRGARVLNLRFHPWAHDHEDGRDASGDNKALADVSASGHIMEMHAHHQDSHRERHRKRHRQKFPDVEMEVETWIRIEDGRVVQRVGLNGTYSEDQYPSETGEERADQV